MVMRAPGKDRTAGTASALVLVLAFAGCLGDRPTALDEGDGGSGGEGGLAGGGTGGASGSKGSGGAGAGTGGTIVGSGGAITGSGGAGGATATGGATANGGATGTGGAIGTGGALGMGGATATGGAKGTGGVVATGGVPGTGGVVATGGVKGTGGVVATGGMKGTGGVVATGGVIGTGGVVATGGVTGTGGIIATGGVTGTGGTSVVCSLGQSRCVNSNTQEEDCQSNGQWGPATGCAVTCVGTTCAACVPGTQMCSGSSANETCGANGQWQTAVACPLPYPPNPACTSGHCAYHEGVDQKGGTDSMEFGYLYALEFETGQAATTASRLGMFGTSTTQGVRLAIYSSSGIGQPLTLLGQTSTTAVANGAVEAALAAPITLAALTHYWIVAIASATITIGFSPGGVGYSFNTFSPYPTFPTSFPTGGISSDTSETPDFYVVLQDQ
jgi:hypothetical protein